MQITVLCLFDKCLKWTVTNNPHVDVLFIPRPVALWDSRKPWGPKPLTVIKHGVPHLLLNRLWS